MPRVKTIRPLTNWAQLNSPSTFYGYNLGISDFNQCVVGLYNNASLWGFSLGGLLLTLGTAYAVTQKNEAASVIIAVPLIGLGATHIALGGMLKRKANEYEALTGN